MPDAFCFRNITIILLYFTVIVEQFVLKVNRTFCSSYNKFGDIMKFQRIRDLREDTDLTQAQMGKAINLPQRTYAYYESGERTIPPEVLIALAKFHKTSVDYILGLTDKK